MITRELFQDIFGFRESTQLYRERKDSLAHWSRTAEVSPYLVLVSALALGAPAVGAAVIAFVGKLAYERLADHRRRKTGNIRVSVEEFQD